MTAALAFVSRRVHFSGLLVVILAAISAACLVAGLFEVVEGLDQALILRLALFAFLIGWLFSKWIRPGWAGISIGLIAGVLILWFRLGQMGGKVWLVVWQSALYIDQLKSVLTHGVPLAAALTAVWNALLQAASGVSLRILTWFVAYAHGKAAFDPVAVLFLWAFLVWAAVYWTAWAAQRRYQTLTILLPSLVLLSATLGYANQYSITILFFLAALLLLSILSSQVFHEEAWQRAQIDFTLEIRLDLAMISLPIVIAILIVALVLPSVSIREIAEAVQGWTQNQNSRAETIGQPLGLHPKPAQIVNRTFIDFVSAGLPRSHLIGSGPELSQKVVFTVHIDNVPSGTPNPQPQTLSYYWRGTTYDQYAGTGWLTSSFQVKAVPAGKGLLPLDPAHDRPLHQEVNLVESVGNIAYYSGSLLSANRPLEAALRSGEDIFAASIRAQEYSVESAVPNYSRQSLTAAGREVPDWVRQKYLQLPAGLPERVRSLARDITASALTPYDQAKAIETYLRNYPYTLALPAPPANRDIVDYFLFDLKKGYCDYYASSMVVLARSIGLPARLVTGYASGTYDPGSSRYIVTEADAHSWPEIYFSGYGWVEFEPTAARTDLDSLQDRPLLPSELAEPPISGGQPPRLPLSPVQPWLAWVMTGLFGAALFGLLTWWRIQTFRLAHLPPEKIAVRLYRQLHSFARRIQIPIFLGDTPLEFSERVKISLSAEWNRESDLHKKKEALNQLDALIWLYIQSSYTPNWPTRFQADQGIGYWSRLRGQLLFVWLKQRFSRRKHQF